MATHRPQCDLVGWRTDKKKNLVIENHWTFFMFLRGKKSYPTQARGGIRNLMLHRLNHPVAKDLLRFSRSVEEMALSVSRT